MQCLFLFLFLLLIVGAKGEERNSSQFKIFHLALEGWLHGQIVGGINLQLPS